MQAMNRWDMAFCTLMYPLHLFFFYGDIKFFLLKFIHIHPFEITIIQKGPQLFFKDVHALRACTGSCTPAETACVCSVDF